MRSRWWKYSLLLIAVVLESIVSVLTEGRREERAPVHSAKLKVDRCPMCQHPTHATIPLPPTRPVGNAPVGPLPPFPASLAPATAATPAPQRPRIPAGPGRPPPPPLVQRRPPRPPPRPTPPSPPPPGLATCAARTGAPPPRAAPCTGAALPASGPRWWGRAVPPRTHCHRTPQSCAAHARQGRESTSPRPTYAASVPPSSSHQGTFSGTTPSTPSPDISMRRRCGRGVRRMTCRRRGDRLTPAPPGCAGTDPAASAGLACTAA